MPHQALELSGKVIAGEISSMEAEKETGRWCTHCDDLSFTFQSKQDIIMVGYGAIQTVREALEKQHFGCEQVTDDSSDMDIDPYDHDASFCASVAYCGAPPWIGHSGSLKRLEFWTWWLSSALCIYNEGAH
jgi:hypothetical protein